MGGKYADALIVCPYYIGQDGQRIKCKGVGAIMTDVHYFKRGRDKRIWTSKFCTSLTRCRDCPYVKGIAQQE